MAEGSTLGYQKVVDEILATMKQELDWLEAQAEYREARLISMQRLIRELQKSCE